MPDRRYLEEVKNMRTQQNDRRRLSSSGLDGSQVTAQNRSQDEPRVVAAYQEDGGKMPEKKIINLKKNPKILQLMNKNRDPGPE
jgi:hypothetical protein